MNHAIQNDEATPLQFKKNRISANQELINHFLQIRNATEKLVNPLENEDLMVSATPDTSPIKWHLAHTTWFYERFILSRFDLKHKTFNDTYGFLFNSYYQSLGPHLPKEERHLISRPTVEEVLSYRLTTDKNMVALLEVLSPALLSEIAPILELGLHHEQQHQELILMDIKQNFYAHPFKPIYRENLNFKLHAQHKIMNQWVHFNGGLVQTGHANPSLFHFDHERGRHLTWLEPYQLSSHLVSNDEYLEFVELGGYENQSYWLSDGWEWLKKEKIVAPLYWFKENNQWLTMTLHGVDHLDLTEPVSHISYYEAQAFAKWRGCRLPTEFEWEHAAELEKNEGIFLEQKQFHPSVREEVPAQSRFTGIHGELWEWTQSAFLPYPHYQVPTGPLSEYNSKFMCNQTVMRGGSCITPRSHYRYTYRNFFYPHQRWQFSGLRLAMDGENAH